MENEQHEPQTEIVYWKKSWVAYVGELFSSVFAFAFFFILVAIAITALDFFGALKAMGVLEALNLKVLAFADIARLAAWCAVMMTAIAVFLRMIWLATFRLYYDEDGIWIFSGIFPWTKGVYGMRWCDLDSITYRTGLFPWLTHAYHVSLTHRFTNTRPLMPSSIAKGDQFVMEANRILMDNFRE